MQIGLVLEMLIELLLLILFLTWFCQVFFEEQLKKHDGTCALIQANLDAQPKILKWAPNVFLSILL